MWYRCKSGTPELCSLVNQSGLRWLCGCVPSLQANDAIPTQTHNEAFSSSFYHTPSKTFPRMPTAWEHQEWTDLLCVCWYDIVPYHTGFLITGTQISPPEWDWHHIWQKSSIYRLKSRKLCTRDARALSCCFYLALTHTLVLLSLWGRS